MAEKKKLSRKTDVVDFSFLLYHSLVKRVKGTYVLTPKGERFFEANAHHQAGIHQLMREHNNRLREDALKLVEILASAKRKKSSPAHSWIMPKPPAVPKKRRRLTH